MILTMTAMEFTGGKSFISVSSSIEVDTDNDFTTLKEQRRLADAANFCVADVRVKVRAAEEKEAAEREW